MPQQPSTPLPDIATTEQQNTECILESLEDGCGRLRVVRDKKLLALIEYWPVNADYEGAAYSSPQGNAGNGERSQAGVQSVPQLPLPDGPRRIWVRAVDMATVAGTAQEEA
jgi:hypothetical protein